MIELIDLVQWPAMVVSLAGSWFVGSDNKKQRLIGFSCFLAGNFCWIAWGIHDHAAALIITQCLYIITSSRGIFHNRK